MKDKKAGDPLADQSQAEEVGGKTPTPANGEPKAPPIRKSWSSPIQAMAKIEQLMGELDDKQRRIVGSWFISTYFQEVLDGKQLPLP